MSIQPTKPPSDRFTRISNLWIRDLRLSWKARGLLAWLTSHATGFRVSEKTIVCAAPDGRDAARAAIGELEAYGYLVRERERGRDGRLGGVTYIICDPWSPRLTAAKPRPENPLLAPTSADTAKPQVAAYDGKPNVGKPTRIRRPEKQEDQNPEKISENPPLLAVGEPADRRGPGAAPTPAANPEELSRMAAELLGRLPDHYRRAPAWLRSRLLKKISEALTRHSPPAIADGTACSGCGRDPRHPFCDAEVGDTSARPGPEVPPHPSREAKAASAKAPPGLGLLPYSSSEPLASVEASWRQTRPGPGLLEADAGTVIGFAHADPAEPRLTTGRRCGG
ncbi:hypothetical protein OG884_34145 [Streptosporangium sp. NBC_01755]|uniref:hypothetical protein n=1 Tax=Streptosporangium sp. NBC_01755 TaxID=2975949 RepID=UPI002DDC1123|nr:hypothetical protein [Streptosporangium sp. NBC_01755]WSC99784.1 hypothetical protein OG884_34145 [Streptosporangium sp. NBC_01755]